LVSVLRDREGEGEERSRAGSLLITFFPFPILSYPLPPIFLFLSIFPFERMSSDSASERRKERNIPLGEFSVLYSVRRELGTESNNAAVACQIIRTARVSRTKKQSIFFTWRLYSVPHYPLKRTSRHFTDTEAAWAGTPQCSSCISRDDPIESIRLGLNVWRSEGSSSCLATRRSSQYTNFDTLTRSATGEDFTGHS
jgi:hypothetical protein